MEISQIPVKFIFHSYSESSTFGRPGLGRSTPHLKWQFHRFLLWQLLFHSYSESLSFGRPGLGRSTPPSNGDFTDSCSDSSYFTTLRAQHLADQVLADLTPPHQWQFHRFLLYSESSYLADLSVGRSNPPPSNGNFTDCCSDSSYFIPTLTAPHLADQVLADLSPLINGNFTDSYSTLRAHIWQTKCWQIYPPSNGNFTDSCEIHISFLL